MGQWLGLDAFPAMSPGSIPGQGNKILQTFPHRHRTEGAAGKVPAW